MTKKLLKAAERHRVQMSSTNYEEIVAALLRDPDVSVSVGRISARLGFDDAWFTHEA